MYSEAIAEYIKALQSRPDLPGLRLELGEIYGSNSDWEKAEQQFREEAELQPGSAEAAYRLGSALLEEGKMEGAAEELRRSDRLRPDMPETLYALGKASAVSNPKQAEQALNRVIAIEKDTQLAGTAYFVLAGIHRKQGKTELAAQELTRRATPACSPRPLQCSPATLCSSATSARPAARRSDGAPSSSARCSTTRCETSS